jgi:hypothetical protein
MMKMMMMMYKTINYAPVNRRVVSKLRLLYFLRRFRFSFCFRKPTKIAKMNEMKNVFDVRVKNAIAIIKINFKLFFLMISFIFQILNCRLVMIVKNKNAK